MAGSETIGTDFRLIEPTHLRDVAWRESYRVFENTVTNLCEFIKQSCQVLEGNMTSAGNMSKSLPYSYFHRLSTEIGTIRSRTSAKLCLARQ
jgi:hypothetical protein